MSPNTHKVLTASLLAQMALLGTATAQTTWDAGAGVDTNIDTAANWNNNVLPANDGTASVAFGTGGSIANFNTDYFFKDVTLNRVSAFSLNSSSGNVIIRSSNSGSTYNLTMSSGPGAVQTINAPLRISTNNADTNKLFVVRNNNTSFAMEVKGGIALATGSSTNYNMRYEGVAGSVTRIEGAVSGMTSIQQGANAWAGTVLFAGSRTMGTNITAATAGAGVGSITGNIQLGETVSDVQSWGAVTLNSALKVVVGGDATVTGITGTAAGSLVGTAQTGGLTSKLTVNLASASTIGSTISLGGAGANENNLSLIKTGIGTLTLNGTGTYTGDTTVSAGTLLIGASERIANTSRAVLAGGTLSIAAGFTETLGALDLDANGVINLAGTNSQFVFASSLGQDWASSTLSITGTFLDGFSVGFGSQTGLSSGQLAAITVNGASGWGLNSSGFLVSAVPEPSTYAVFAGGLMLVAAVYRRRRSA